MKKGIIVQARNGSTRFPFKSLQDIKGKPLIYWVLFRAGKADVDVKVVATTYLSEDDSIEEIAKSIGWSVFRGDPNDVLSRYALCTLIYGLDIVIRVTGDCPLIDYRLINLAVEEFGSGGFDYLTIVNIANGFNVEVINANVLIEAFENARLPSEREHVTPYIKNNPRFKKKFLEYGGKDFSSIRLSVDYPEDLSIIRRIFNSFPSYDFSYEDVVKLLEHNGSILEGAKEVHPSYGYFKSLEKDKEFVIDLVNSPKRKLSEPLSFLYTEKIVSDIDDLDFKVVDDGETLKKRLVDLIKGEIPFDPVVLFSHDFSKLLEAIMMESKEVVILDACKLCYLSKNDVVKIITEAKEKGKTVVFDERKTSLRFSIHGVSGYFGIYPDAIILGKNLTNGKHSLFTLVANSDVFNGVGDVSFIVDNQSLSLAILVITHVLRRKVIETIGEKGSFLINEIKRIIYKLGLENIIEIKGYSPLFGFKITHDRKLEIKSLIRKLFFVRGVYIDDAFFVHPHHSYSTLREFVDVTEEVLSIVLFAIKNDIIEKLLHL